MLVDKGHVLHAKWVKEDLEREVRRGLLLEEALRNRPPNPVMARLGDVLIAAGERLQKKRQRTAADLTEAMEVLPAHSVGRVR